MTTTSIFNKNSGTEFKQYDLDMGAHEPLIKSPAVNDHNKEKIESFARENRSNLQVAASPDQTVSPGTEVSMSIYQVNSQRFVMEEYKKDGVLHRDDGPASTSYHLNGVPAKQEYYQNGKLHREDGPAIIRRDENGFATEFEYFVNGQANSKNGPSLFHRNEKGDVDHVAYKQGSGYLHRTDGPATISYDSLGRVTQEGYYQNGKHHRDDGPAAIMYDSSSGAVTNESYFKQGKLQNSVLIEAGEALGIRHPKVPGLHTPMP